MRKKILLGSIGLVTILAAVLLFGLFLITLNESPNYIYLIGSIFCTAIMIYSFIKANAPVAPSPSLPVKHEAGMNNILQTNNEMIKTFNNTERQQEQLRILEAAGESESQS